MKYYKGIISQCLDWRKSVFRHFDVKIPAKKLNRSKNYLYSDTDLAIWSARTNKPSKSDYRTQESVNRECFISSLKCCGLKVTHHKYEE